MRPAEELPIEQRRPGIRRVLPVVNGSFWLGIASAREDDAGTARTWLEGSERAFYSGRSRGCWRPQVSGKLHRKACCFQQRQTSWHVRVRSLHVIERGGLRDELTSGTHRKVLLQPL